LIARVHNYYAIFQDQVNQNGIQPKPKGNPPVTHGVTDKRREEEKRKDKRRGEEEKEEEKEEEDSSSGSSSSFFGKVFKKTKRKPKRVEENTDLMIRIGAWFLRKPETLWQTDEADALASLGPIPEDELDFLEWWFLEVSDGDTTDKDDERNYKRQRVLHLLNNWSGEIDRANKYKRRHDLIWGDYYGPEL